MPKIIPNTSYYNNDTLITNQEIEISNTNIAAIRPATTVSNNQSITVPGFIDLQIYGAGGRLFSADPTIESLTIMENDLLKKEQRVSWLAWQPIRLKFLMPASKPLKRTGP